MNKPTRFTRELAMILVTLCLILCMPTRAEPPGVVYHIDSPEQVIRALRNIANHRKVYPDLPITVVALAGGVNFLVDGTRDERGNSFAAMVEPLAMEGIVFNACGNTLKSLSIDPDRLAFGVEVVQSGVAEIGRLQLEQGYAYIKP